VKRIVQIAAILMLVAVGGQLVFLRFGRANRLPSVAPTFPQVTAADLADLQTAGAPAAPAAPVDLPIGATREVDLSADEESLVDLDRRERVDQYLDWLLFAAVAGLRPNPEEYSKIFFDLPPSRIGYMRPVGTFEFGETRSRLIGGGEVVALVPAGRDAAERIDQLAGIADEHRKNQAGEFDHLIVIEYDLDVDHDRAVLKRLDDMPYATLFSAEYGYHQAPVTTRAELATFMATVDDLTMVHRSDRGLVLGGRKLRSRAARSIGVEEVATVWKADQKIQSQRTAFDARAKQAFDELDAKWSNRTYRTATEKARLEAQLKSEVDALRSTLADERRALKLVNGSGFSLDPAVEFDGLDRAFTTVLPRLRVLAPDLITDEQATAVSDGLARRDIVPFRKLMRATANPLHGAAHAALHALEQKYSYQYARYDGDLQGTEVGMILFYTDLLAKLWVIDYVDSSPRRGNILGFVDDPNAPRSLIYAEENATRSYARLWFGYSNLGFETAEDKDTIYLARIATRIYSAGSDPTNPGVEVQTSSMLAASTDWWNDHYEEVARFEPQYQRLNQLMKWSIVIGWLDEANAGPQLGYLADVPIERGNVLPQWVRRHPELRFTRWADVKFLPAGFDGTTTEALPRLSGPVTEGGVSFATKDMFAERAPIARTVEMISRRSNLDYAAVGSNTLKTLDEGLFTFNRAAPNEFSVVARAKPEALFRSPTAQLARTDIERLAVSHGDDLTLQIRTAQASVGDLKIASGKNGFTVGWRSREIDVAHSLARRMSFTKDPDLALLTDPNVEAVMVLPGDGVRIAKLRGSTAWVKLAPERQPSVEIADGWQLRAAVDEHLARRSMQASVVDEATVRAALGRDDLVLELAEGQKPFVRPAANETPPPTGVVELTDGEVTLTAWVESPDGPVRVLARRGATGTDPLAIAQKLGPDEIGAIRRAAASGDSSPIRLDAPSRARLQLVDELENNRFRDAAATIADNPTAAREVLDRRIAVELRRNAEVREREGADAALHDLDRLIDAYGNRPDLTLRRALVQIERGNPQAAATAVPSRPMPLHDRAAFFDEVNERLVMARARNDDLRRFAQFADWQDLTTRAPARDLGAVRPLMDGDEFRFELELATAPVGEPVSLAEVDRLGRRAAIVYRQDGAGLDALDWNGSVEQALHGVVTGRLGKVIRLPREDIAHFRPAAIWSPEHHVRFEPVGHLTGLHVPTYSYRPCDPDTLDCDDDSSHGFPAQQEVYLVMAN
jgi:hypothetical protein